MSAILTYFPLVVTENGFVTKDFVTNESSLPTPGAGTVIALAAQARSHGAGKTYRVSAREAKAPRAQESVTPRVYDFKGLGL
jgi:hypothetical protein